MGKRAASPGPEDAAGFPAGPAGLPPAQPFPEHAARLDYAPLRRRLEAAEAGEGEAVTPGLHGCCAYCGGPPPAGAAEPHRCPACRRVTYCCAKHARLDAAAHGRVCAHLQHVAALERVAEADWLAALDRTLAAPEREPAEAAEAGPAAGWREYFERAGWAAGRAAAGGGKRRKVLRDGEREPGAPGPDEAAVRCLVAAVLSYPLSLAHALLRQPQLAAVHAKLGRPRRRFGVHVLGAAAAECRHPAGWAELLRTLELGLGGPEGGGERIAGIDIALVGLEVPDRLHAATVQVGAGARVALHGWKGDYVRHSIDSRASHRAPTDL